MSDDEVAVAGANPLGAHQLLQQVESHVEGRALGREPGAEIPTARREL